MVKNDRTLPDQAFQSLRCFARMAVAITPILVLVGFCCALTASAEVIQGDEARKQSSMTARSIKWETSLDAAEAKAKQNNKPIMWVHMLGNIDGYT